MSTTPDGEFRGRIPGTGGPGAPSGPPPSQQWGWNPRLEEPRRLPLLGVFLIAFGALLLLGQFLPGVRVLGSALVVAVGVVLLVSWTQNRRAWELYGGAILAAISLPSFLADVGLIDGGNGWGTLFLGIAFLLIALLRAGAGGGFGWQAIVGAVLAVLGGWQVAARSLVWLPDLDRLFWPVLILALGAVIVLRSVNRRR